METLEEAAERFYPPTTTDLICSPKLVRDAFIAGGNHMAERMYYEEEVTDLIADWTKMAEGLNMNFPADKFEDWFKKMKKK
jgi:hypothetical protein